MNIIPWANVVLLLRNVRWERERRIIIENVSLAQIAVKIRSVNEDFLFFKFSLQLATLFNFSREVGGLGLLCLCCVSILSILMKPLRHFFSPGFTIFQVWNIVGKNLEPGNSVPALFWRNSEKKDKNPEDLLEKQQQKLNKFATLHKYFNGRKADSTKCLLFYVCWNDLFLKYMPHEG